MQKYNRRCCCGRKIRNDHLLCCDCRIARGMMWGPPAKEVQRAPLEAGSVKPVWSKDAGPRSEREREVRARTREAKVAEYFRQQAAQPRRAPSALGRRRPEPSRFAEGESGYSGLRYG